MDLQLEITKLPQLLAQKLQSTLRQTRKGTIYGLGSVQFKNICPSELVPATLKRSLDMEMRVCGLETLT
ncbi:hypothetical protein F2Q68_00020591 [Brassica cretica]|uniref:Uncharacterized protein n=1 Tax=Brassica cretica TaxID=69181 RepID=A0A8S9FZD3_BRACR|nr:hypothetical protein F2Q68_00020591 [Brassica cretica]